MARRASSGLNPTVLIGVAVAVVAAFFGGKLLLTQKASASLDGTELDMTAVVENANSLRGNTYVVEGKVDEKLRWTPDRGQVISLKVEDGGDTRYLGIEIPPDLSSVNIEREQQYAFEVSFHQGGIARAENIARR